MGVAPTVYAGARMITTVHVYDDQGRMVQSIPSPAWTVEDRALVQALQNLEGEKCGGCGQPRHVAWHGDMDGWYEQTSFVCHACTALEGHQRAYRGVIDTRPADHRPLSPFVLGKTTTSADPPKKT